MLNKLYPNQDSNQKEISEMTNRSFIMKIILRLFILVGGIYIVFVISMAIAFSLLSDGGA